MANLYEVPVIWQMCGKILVEAASLDEAIDLALRDAPLPEEQWYIDDSITTNTD